jgi:hypothetical protein
MNLNDTRLLDADPWDSLERFGKPRENATPFVVWPLYWNAGHLHPAPLHVQHAFYLFACQQAAVVVEEVRRRRRMLFARGFHLWN